MKLDISKVEMSNGDKKRGITIPDELTSELAEFIGIMVGDGHVGRYEYWCNSRKYIVYQITIAGNIIDKDYYNDFVNPLAKKLFNHNFRIYYKFDKNTILLTMESKAMFTFLSRVFEIPNRKDNILLNKYITLGNEKIKSAFLRGYFDADGCICVKHKPNKYPVVKATSKSKGLIYQCSEILTELGILNNVINENQYYAKRNITYHNSNLYVNGFDRVTYFLLKVGFRDPEKVRRFLNKMCEIKARGGTRIRGVSP